MTARHQRNSLGLGDSENLYSDRCVAITPWPWPAHIDTQEEWPWPAHIDTQEEIPVLVGDPVLDLGPDLDDPKHRAPDLAIHPDVASVVATPGASPPPASAAAVLPAVGRVICHADANFQPYRRCREREDAKIQANGYR